MNEFTVPELGVKISFPKGWEAIYNKDFFVDIFEMNEEEAIATDLMLVYDAEVVDDIRFIYLYSNPQEYVAEDDYKKEFDETLAQLRKAFEQISVKEPRKTKNNFRMDKVIAKPKNSGDKILYVQYYVYVNNLFIMASTEIERENDNLDKTLNDIIDNLAIAHPPRL